MKKDIYANRHKEELNNWAIGFMEGFEYAKTNQVRRYENLKEHFKKYPHLLPKK